jgi:Icc-related predicted phosphoesterase
MPRIVCISDTHARQRRIAVPDGDILLHAGDLTDAGDLDQLADFDHWLGELPHRHKVVICGNHDFCFEQNPKQAQALVTNAIYLQDSAVTIEGLKIYGSPWQPWFCDWAFNLQRGPELAAVWAKIPDDTDILITHGPPEGILDMTHRSVNVGCRDLLERVYQVSPRLHVFGHIHEAAGRFDVSGITFVNATTLPGQSGAIVVELASRTA